MKTPSILCLGVISLVFCSCKREETTLSYEERKTLPPEVNAQAPQPPPDTGSSQTGGGTRADYKPTTGPGGQAESNPATPPTGENPSPTNPNVTPPGANGDKTPPPADPNATPPPEK